MIRRMTRLLRISRVAVLSALLTATVDAGDKVPDPSALDRAHFGIVESQVTIILRGPRSSRFRATVIARSGRDLVAVTAAHCLAGADAGKPVFIRHGESILGGRIGKVIRNPAYQEPRFPQLMGTDNAIVSLRADADGKDAARVLEGIQAVGVATGPIPSPDGQRVVVRIPDQHGKEHVIPAGNYANPKILTWGLRFKPVGGDSGSGVFVLRQVPGAEPAPILIGVVVGADDRGGGASLIHARHPWVAQSLNDEAKTGR
jgi:hypothetical protein